MTLHNKRKFPVEKYMALIICFEVLLLVCITCFVLWNTSGQTSENDSDFEISFTPTYDPSVHLGYVGQEDTLPESPGGSCGIEVTLKNPREDQFLSSIVVTVHDLVSETSATLYLNQALYVGPNIVLPGKKVSLGAILIGFATRDQRIPCLLSFSYDVTWETMDANGMYVGTQYKKDFQGSTVLPAIKKE